MNRVVFTFALIALVTGCATTNITAFRDPAYTDKSYSSVAVFAQGMALEDALEVEKQVCTKIQPTPCKVGKNILPPIREYSNEEVGTTLYKSGVQGILFIALVGDKSDTRYLGTISNSNSYGTANTTGTANFYGNSAYWNASTHSSVSTQTTTTPVYSHTRIAYGQIGLFDRESGAIIWKGEFKVEGKGAASVTDGAFIKSATSKIAEELRATQLIE